MSILSKVVGAPFICKVYLDFNGSLTALSGAEHQNFYNSLGNQYTWKPLHIGLKTVSFSDKEKTSRAGSSYEQQLKVSFANTDSLRTDRIEKIKSTKFVRIELSNGQSIVMGRNDYFQNKPLEVTYASDEVKTTITFKTVSIFPIGLLEINDVSSFIDFLIPTEQPNNLISI
ncbi:hypothetical protein [Mariniflexile sp.]|uniref:hypothetical protein n=1 Tax=Mariniflexile sp. TaxID=1979402 RepID=UPI003568875B